MGTAVPVPSGLRRFERMEARLPTGQTSDILSLIPCLTLPIVEVLEWNTLGVDRWRGAMPPNRTC